ncbi:hypothetical protein [Snodgrassella gandavensis]|uniref:hypothetical protein n=1 Tax=Snodgrassella gandavensis TaxID=2946698 RepID=UPI001EF5B4E8|nr:hypothetical protein [Snodgrassella gandavensis]
MPASKIYLKHLDYKFLIKDESFPKPIKKLDFGGYLNALDGTIKDYNNFAILLVGEIKSHLKDKI